ncbi:MAG TPA: DcaP family trimeric outer membrane transporter [Gemmatimonadaceae bacterium]|nr:DcaP family trimeric outer membrane transporter [Gemmatimonadaceae bacterium]
MLAAAVLALGIGAEHVAAQDGRAKRPEKKDGDTSTVIEVYGFAQGDFIFDFRSNNPDWFDVNRPTKIPAFVDEFGGNGRTWFSIRQSRFGTKATIPTSTKPIYITWEWDLFGVGIDAGQTTIRPRLMYGQWGPWGAGQLWSPFMDNDVFPNILDYWGPNGMMFFRNVQVFWQPIKRDDGTRATIALERPGASGDAGRVADRVELQNIIARFPLPDVSAEYRRGFKWGYLELAGIYRYISWNDVLLDPFDLGGHDHGWGVSLSSNVKPGRNDVIRFQVVYGEGVENYFNDAPVDIGVKLNPGNLITPVVGEALGDFGGVLYLDHNWSKTLSSAIGYSRVEIDNSNLQLPTAFKAGNYASTNLLWAPVPAILIGGEFQWGWRQNFQDDFVANDYRVQFAMKYNFSQKFGGKKQ